MFDSLRVPISMPLDDKGYFDRRCPSAECRSNFKVLFEDWRDKVRDDLVYCPICRGEAEGTEWNTPEQRRYIEQAALRHLHKAIGELMHQEARRINRAMPKSGFITMSMSYKPGTPPLVIPCEAAEAMQQEFVCEACDCQYAAVGAAFFCPACGHNSAISTFQTAVDTIRTTIGRLCEIKEAVQSAAGHDAAENTARHLVEDSLCRLVASFQRFAEALFAQLPNAAQFPVRKNLFQNINASSAHWRKATGKGYEGFLDSAEIADLKRLFEQRHLLAHKEGIVDQEYIDKSGDSTYSVGQRLVVREAAVARLADLVSKLAAGLQTTV